VDESRSANSKHVLNRNAAEYERLSAQARAWGPATRQALGQSGLSSGMSALDVGCGTGAVMRLMAELVGPTGRVTGIDSDRSIGEEGVKRLRNEGPDIFAFVQADIRDLGRVAGGPFDLVFARLLLIHLPEPLTILRRLWEWVRPGGTLLIMDYDMTVCRSLPANATVDRALDLMRGIFTGSGKDIEIGTRMPALFMQAGIGDADRCDVSGVVMPETGGGGMLRALLASLRNAAIEHSVADAKAMYEIDFQLSRLPPGGFGRWPDLVATQKRKANGRAGPEAVAPAGRGG